KVRLEPNPNKVVTEKGAKTIGYDVVAVPGREAARGQVAAEDSTVRPQGRASQTLEWKTSADGSRETFVGGATVRLRDGKLEVVVPQGIKDLTFKKNGKTNLLTAGESE